MAKHVLNELCNLCEQHTDHDVVHTETISRRRADVTATVMVEILSCRGCKEICVKERLFEGSTFGDVEKSPSRIIFTPPRLWRRPPRWLADLEPQDPDLMGLLEEVYSAAHTGQVRLLSMGIRSVLDRMMTMALDGNVSSFREKLKEMVAKGHLAAEQASNIEIIIDAGSASAHRGFKPARELLEEMLNVMESLVRERYISGPMLQTAKVNIPPRPRINRKNSNP